MTLVTLLVALEIMTSTAVAWANPTTTLQVRRGEQTTSFVMQSTNRGGTLGYRMQNGTGSVPLVGDDLTYVQEKITDLGQPNGDQKICLRNDVILATTQDGQSKTFSACLNEQNPLAHKLIALANLLGEVVLTHR